jgi:hypothetical protein
VRQDDGACQPTFPHERSARSPDRPVAAARVQRKVRAMTVRFFYSTKVSMGRNGRRNVYVEVENARGSGVPFTWQSEALNDQSARDDLEEALAQARRLLDQIGIPYTLEPIDKKGEP